MTQNQKASEHSGLQTCTHPMKADTFITWLNQYLTHTTPSLKTSFILKHCHILLSRLSLKCVRCKIDPNDGLSLCVFSVKQHYIYIIHAV